MSHKESELNIKQPNKKKGIAAKAAEEFKLTDEPAIAINLGDCHDKYGERLRTAITDNKKPHLDENTQKNEILLEKVRFASILANKSPNPIIGINPDTSIAYVNTALEKLTGYSSDELIGLKIPHPWWIESNLKETRQNFEKTLEIGDCKVEKLFKKKNGELFWVEISSTVIKEKEQLQYVLFNWVDITEWKRDKEALRDTTYELKESVKELDCLYKVSLLKDVPDKTLNEFLQVVVFLIPPAGQHPERTCAKITFEGNEFKTDNFENSPNKLTADLRVAGRSVGTVEVYYLGHESENNKGTFLEEKRALVDTIAREMGKYITLIRADERIKVTHERLITEQITLTKKNVALKEIISQIENEKKQSAFFIQSNINKIIMPILRKLRDKAGPDEKHYILLLLNSLEEISSPFINELELKYSELFPREIQICNMIKNGMTTKEIASNLEISIETIRSQRKSIRRKLGIANNKIPLTTFLRQS